MPVAAHAGGADGRGGLGGSAEGRGRVPASVTVTAPAWITATTTTSDRDLDRDRDRDLDRDYDLDHERERTASVPGPTASLRCRIRAVAEGYVSFAREYPGLFAMACHGGVDDAVALVAERVGALPRSTGLAVWSAAHGVAVLTGSDVDEKNVLDIVLAGIVPPERAAA